ncbi:MAG: response regulator [Alphaproteobacteria bacterium]
MEKNSFDDPAKQRKYNFSSLSLMICDDNQPLRTMFCQICRNFGFKTVYECGDGTEALRLLAVHSIDILITEAMMIPMNGVELTWRIRNSEGKAYQFMPIIMLTSHTEESRVMRSRDAGITEFLAKPAAPSTLLSRLIYAMENSRMFVTTKTYSGPDRRRHHSSQYPGPERRGILPPEEEKDPARFLTPRTREQEIAVEEAVETVEAPPPMSQGDVDKLFD